MTLCAKSIPGFSRKREPIALLFCTPPGSPFRALPPTVDPMMEPTCHRGEKDGLLSAVLIEYLIDLFLIYLSLNINNKDKHNNALPKDVLKMFSTTIPLNLK
jgi:hypothetical protein